MDEGGLVKRLLLVAVATVSFQASGNDSSGNTSNQCLERISSLSVQEQDRVEEATDLFITGDAIAYIHKQPSMLAVFYKGIDKEYKSHPDPLAPYRKSLTDAPDKTDTYMGGKYSLSKKQKFVDFDAELTSNMTETEQEAVRNYVQCEYTDVILGKSYAVDAARKYAEYAQPQKTKDRVGYFDVAVIGGKVNKQVGTGNKYTEPKQWEGSRFLTINASFKNLDTESRLPIEGSVFINYDGKEYEFDSVEPIMMEGYNIWFKKINPLITMKTKLVYRIPDEIHGPVYWRPGRNPTDTRLWVGNIEAAK